MPARGSVHALAVALAAFALLPLPAAPQERTGGDAPAEVPSIEERTEGMRELDGFIPLYWDETTGKLRMEILPDTADPMDVRYNVVQWVHRSTRGWSYGNSISDPRTGEILKGHVACARTTCSAKGSYRPT